MSPTKANGGFTLIELLVTLSILGLLVATVVPSINSWLNSRANSAKRQELTATIALLPLKAKTEGQKVVVNSAEQLIENAVGVIIEEPIVILPNGFCTGGSLRIEAGDLIQKFNITSPFCKLITIQNDA